MDDPPAIALGLLAQLRQLDEDGWNSGTLTERAITLHRLRALQGEAHRIGQAIEDDLAATMETDNIDVPGLGRLTRVEQSQSTWTDGGASERMRDDLARAVSDSIALDIATGEIDVGKRNVAIVAIRAAYEAIPAFSSLKVAGRNRFGLHIGDYRQFFTHYRVNVEALEEQ